MPPFGKQPTAAELAALEHAFAADPSSDAYRPLTEAYLAMGRFMEAMVVSKKGVKAHADDPSPRVLLARVYAEQGKDRKAVEELSAVLQAHPGDVAANRLAGILHFRLGENDQGAAALLRAHAAAPGAPETVELMQKYGVDAGARGAAAAPTQAATPAAPRAAHPDIPVAPRVAPRPAGSSAAAPVTRRPPEPESVDVELTPSSGTPAARGPRNEAYAKELAEKYATQEFQLAGTGEWRAKRSRKGALVTTAALGAVLAVGLGGWWYYQHAQKERAVAIDRELKAIQDELARDAYPAYVEAAKRAAEVVRLDDANIAGHAFLAYVDALRHLEHGDPDAIRDEAAKQVDAGRALGRHSHLLAAEAYLRHGAGETAAAIGELEGLLEGDAQSTLLQGVLGLLEMQAGDLDAAREILGRAQKANPGDVRIAEKLAEQYRRRGDGYELQATAFYDYALRLQKDHVPSILGKALILLDRGQPEEAGRAAQLVLAPQAGASRRQLALARMIRGSALHAAGKSQEGAAEEAEAVKLDPQNADLAHLLGQRKLREGDAAGAAEAFQRALSTDSRRVAFYADLTRALLRTDGGAPKAIDVLKKAVTRLGESPRLALLLGDAYRATGDGDLARGQYEKAIQLGRPYPDARVALAKLLRAQNNVPGALVELTQAIDEYGASGAGGAAQAFVEMAETERSRGAQPTLLLDLYEKALGRDPASCEALWGAGKLEQEGAGRLTEKARDRLTSFSRLCPRSANAAEAARLVGR
jgi:cellulose synthase operon protein C